MADVVRIDRRFRGPAGSANGGYACGRLAAFVDTPVVEVTLRAPPPLDRDLPVVRDADGGVRLRDGDAPIAEARSGSIDGPDEGPVPFDLAGAAVVGFPAQAHHPYPTCFVCGTAREAGDGLRLHPGPVPGRRVVAAPFVPTADLAAPGEDRVAPAFVWASLDCPSWYGWLGFADDQPPILLGRLTGEVREAPRVGERCVVVGWPLRRDGRKIFSGSALYREDGSLAGRARATWIVLRDA